MDDGVGPLWTRELSGGGGEGLRGDAVGDSAGAAGIGVFGCSECGGGESLRLGRLGTIHSPDPSRGDSAEATIGLGNLGTIGAGCGYGSGIGCLGGRRAIAPDVVPGLAQVRGQLDKEIIRRVVRRHLNEVRFCYESELQKHPGLQGRVVADFVIASNGLVIESTAMESTRRGPETGARQAGHGPRGETRVPRGPTEGGSEPFEGSDKRSIADSTVANCIAGAIVRWEFPAAPTMNGVVQVRYPFELTFAGGEE
jgi:hypothetical protein